MVDLRRLAGRIANSNKVFPIAISGFKDVNLDIDILNCYLRDYDLEAEFNQLYVEKKDSLVQDTSVIFVDKITRNAG